MPVSNVWNDPSAGGVLDLTAGTIVTEAYTDALASNLLYLGGSAGKVTNLTYQTSSAALSTTSNTGAAIASPSVTLTTSGTGPVFVMAGVTVSNSTLNALNFLYIVQDAVVSGPYAKVQTAVANQVMQMIGLVVYPSPTVATHTYQPGWATNAGTLSTDTGASSWILAVELRR